MSARPSNHLRPCSCNIWGLFKIFQNYGTPKLPLRRPFTNLSRPSRIGTVNMIIFSYAYFEKNRVDGIGQVSVPVRAHSFYVEKWGPYLVTLSLGQGWVWEDSPFANLSRTFREPFTDFSPKRYNFRNYAFYNLC